LGIVISLTPWGALQELVVAQGSAKSSALSTETHSLDPQLQLLIERWPTLSKAVQQQIMLILKS